MNYPGMRADIVNLFLEAQRALQERAYAVASGRLAKQAVAHAQEYREQIQATAINRGAPSGKCPRCGGHLEQRRGVSRLTHIGRMIRGCRLRKAA